jgi:hypothetical protein
MGDALVHPVPEVETGAGEVHHPLHLAHLDVAHVLPEQAEAFLAHVEVEPEAVPFAQLRCAGSQAPAELEAELTQAVVKPAERAEAHADVDDPLVHPAF